MLTKQKLLFTLEECELIINSSSENNQYWESKNRKYNSFVINHRENTEWLFNRLRNFFETETGIEILKLKSQIHFHKFTKGDWFGKHDDDRNGRLYGVGVLLNDGFDGGDFKLYNPAEQTLNKKAGNSYIFDVKIEHEITPVLKGERYSLLWFLHQDHIKFKASRSLI